MSFSFAGISLMNLFTGGDYENEKKSAGNVDYGASIYSDEHIPEGIIMQTLYTVYAVLTCRSYIALIDFLIGGLWK